MGEIIELINKMSPYLLLGFLLAGVMHAFVPSNLYRRYLGGSSFRSVLNAAILGVPLPLCSCGVIPTAMSLKKEGASKGATVSFLIATPQTGVDSIIATYSLMGLSFALLRPLASLVTALFGGQMVNWFGTKEVAETVENFPVQSSEKETFGRKIVSVFRYAYVDMIQDIGRWLVVGLVVAGLITVFVPDSFFALFADNSFLSMLIVLAFAIPMYLCATGSIPIAVALMMKGLSPGTALVLLMAGPAVNAASMLVVGKVLGKRTLFIYILSIIAGAIAFGLGIDHLLPREIFTAPVVQMEECCGTSAGWFNITCSIVLALLVVNAMILRFRRKDECGCHGDECQSQSRCQSQSQQQSQFRTYQIAGLRCNHCKANAEKAISSLEGVTKVEIDLASGRAVVEGKVEDEAVRKAVETLGYTIVQGE